MRRKTVSSVMLVLLVIGMFAWASRIQPLKAGGSIYFSVEPVAVAPLTDLNPNINALETPPTPSPVGQNFTVEIHLRGATAANVPTGIAGVEVHFFFGNILTYAIPNGFTDYLGKSGGVLTGPPNKILYANQLPVGFYDRVGNFIASPPYTGAAYYEVAAASLATPAWNGADGLIVNITFQIIKQPPYAGENETMPLANDFTDMVDANAYEVSAANVQGSLTIDGNGPPVPATTLVTINADGSITPPAAPISTVDRVTYVFTGDISYPFYDGIVLQRSNIVIDGKGYTVQGDENGTGLLLTGISNVTIRNTKVEGFYYGIYLGSSSSDNSISGNNITNNGMGIQLFYSCNNNSISGNNIVTNTYHGIDLQPGCSNDDIAGNNFTGNNDGICAYSTSNNSIVGNNIVGAPGYFYGSGIYLDDSNGNSIVGNNITENNYGGVYFISTYGYDVLYPCSDNIVSGNNITGNSKGILFYSVSGNVISGNRLSNNDIGIYFYSSSDNVVSGNNVTADNIGIMLQGCSNYNIISGNALALNNKWGISATSSSNYNSISGNNITCVNKDAQGINLYYSIGNIISGNNMIGNDVLDYGIYLSSNSSIVSGNNIANFNVGIAFDGAYDNTISGNNIKNNNDGLFVQSSSSGNVICHNSFINNTDQVYYTELSTNVYDGGYPSGGNYWSDYNGIDLYSGPYQNETGSDGIGDTRYNVSSTLDVDHYPLIHPWSSLVFSSISVLCSPSQVIRGSAVAFTATVSGSSPTGTITWSTTSIGGTFSQSICTLSDGTCSTTYIENYTGSVTIEALYSGDSNNAPSIGSVTLTVTSGQVYYSANYTSIQAAINAVPSGATLILSHGFYTEFLTINKTLTIIGESDPPVFGGGASAIYLTLLSGASGSTITGIEITSWPVGIVLVNASNVRIYGNLLASVGSSGIVLEGENATNNLVYKNVFEGTPNPISLAGSANGNTFFGNVITSQTGVTLNVGGSGNIIYGNTISGSQILLNLTNSENNTIYHNNFLATLQTMVTSAGNNTWDHGYPSGGNYWSNYLTENSNAAEIGSSGLWNTPYVIDSNNTDRYPFMKPWTQASGHCVAVISVAMVKTVIGQGFSCNVTVAVANTGEYAESFNVTAYANSTAIGTQQVKNLNVTGYAVLTFGWNTTSFSISNYTVSAYASPVPNQTNMSENSFTLGMASVTIPGDVNRDFNVGLTDLVLLARAYGSKPGDSNWNLNADIDGNGVVGLSDLVILAQHYGQHYH